MLSPGAPYKIKPSPLSIEIIQDLRDNCHEPLFTAPELGEWANLFEQHKATLSHSEPVCDTSIFDGLSPHPNVSTPQDSSLTRLQTHVRLRQSRTAPTVRNFNFAPGLWIAVWPDEDETTDDFWIAKIITVQCQQLQVHWWISTNGRWRDHGSEMHPEESQQA